MHRRTALLAAPLMGGLLMAPPASAATITLNNSQNCGCFMSSGAEWCSCFFSGTVNSQTKPVMVECYITHSGTTSLAEQDLNLTGTSAPWGYGKCGVLVALQKNSGTYQRQDSAIQGGVSIASGYKNWTP